MGSQSNSKSGPNRRTIRSFVRRTGRLTPSQTRALEELWPVYGIDLNVDVNNDINVDIINDPLDFEHLFSRNAKQVLEIGFGNGESLVEQAAGQPEKDFLGIEVHEPGVGHCLMGIRDARISNLRLIMYDAVPVLERLIPPGSLHRINLYFPDPWPKKRHHKRRIVQTAFVELCARALAVEGALHIATDWEDYAEHIDDVLSQSEQLSCEERREHGGDRPLDRPVTKFEKRGLRHGHRIWDWRFVRVI